MNKKIRVIQAVGSLGIGGNEIFAMNLFRNIDKDKFDIDFIIYDDNKMDFYNEIVNNGGKVYICKSSIRNKYINTIIKIFKTKKILQNNKYDIIHCNSCSFLGLFRGAIAGKFVKNTKVITHSHNSGICKNNAIDIFIRNILKNYLSKIIDLGFACSDIAGESKYTKAFIESKKFKIINNSIEVNKFLFNKDIRNEMRNKYNINNEYVIGNIGRLEYQKNQKFLLDIFAEIKRKTKQVKLIIIGEGELEKELKQYSIDIGIYDDVIFTGKVTNCEKYYNMMDIFVMTSLYEGFPFVMVESQINTLPAVISSEITKSVNIFNNVNFISLNENKDIWAKIILSNNKRISYSKEYENKCNNYDLKYQIKEIEKKYFELVK